MRITIVICGIIIIIIILVSVNIMIASSRATIITF